MPLTTVYFIKKAGNGYRKAIIDPVDIDFFISMGAATTPTIEKGKTDGMHEKGQKEQTEKSDKTAAEAQPDETQQQIDEEPTEPDKGFGDPSSYGFHKNMIMELQTIEDVDEYIQRVTQKKLSKKISSLIGAQRAALYAVREYLANGN